eukprot:scaffold274680_cov27-Tisochrysis_lutea.AAC.1
MARMPDSQQGLEVHLQQLEVLCKEAWGSTQRWRRGWRKRHLGKNIRWHGRMARTQGRRARRIRPVSRPRCRHDIPPSSALNAKWSQIRRWSHHLGEQAIVKRARATTQMRNKTSSSQVRLSTKSALEGCRECWPHKSRPRSSRRPCRDSSVCSWVGADGSIQCVRHWRARRNFHTQRPSEGQEKACQRRGKLGAAVLPRMLCRRTQPMQQKSAYERKHILLESALALPRPRPAALGGQRRRRDSWRPAACSEPAALLLGAWAHGAS